MQTEFEFMLPRGYLDGTGRVHQVGHMRLATALDEVESMHDPRVQANESFLPIVLLARVITQLGDLAAITPEVVGGLFASDLAYLQDLYLRLNVSEQIAVGALCPACNTQFQLQVAPLG